MPMTATQAQQLYVAYFNRPADTLGLAFWMTKDAAAASAAFSTSAEYAATYAGMSTAARVDAIYSNLFGRGAEPAGLTYWGGLIDRGLISVSNAVTQIAGGAQGTDLTAYNNKVKAAEAFTTALDTTAEIVAYSGTAANAAAKVWMTGITTDATLTTATTAAALNASVLAVTAASVGTATGGQSYQLTASSDNFTGTSGADIFNADFSVAGQVSIADQINGGSGADRLLVNGFVGAAAEVVAVAAVRDVKILTPTIVTAGTAATISVTAFGVTATTAALDTSVTAAEVNTLVAATINAIAGSTVATIVGATVVVSAPVAGQALGTITLATSVAGDVTWAQTNPSVSAAAVVGVPATLQSVLPTMTSVENLEILNAVGNADLNFSNYTKAVTGIEAVKLNDVTALNAKTLTVTTGQSVQLSTGAGATATAGLVTVAYAATDANVGLVLSGYQTNGSEQAVTLTGAVASTVNLTATGSGKSEVSTLTLPATAAKLVVTGDKALDIKSNLISGADATFLKEVDASGNTGGVAVKLGAATNAAFKFTGGTGNDTLVLADNGLAAFTAGSQINLGTGTSDKVGLFDTAMTAAEYAALNAVVGLDRIGLNAAVTFDASQVTSTKYYSLDTNAAQSITNMATGSTVLVDIGHAAAITTAGNVGVNDMTFIVGKGTSTGLTLGGTVTFGQTNVAIQSLGTGAGANVITTFANAANSSIVVTGSNALTLTLASSTTTGSKVDASAATGVQTLTAGTGGYSASSARGDVLVGGSAADVLTSGTNSGSLTGNGGNDTFNTSAAVSGGTANANITTITDFTKGDLITFAASAGAFTATAVNLSAATTEQAAIDLLLAGNNSDLKWGVYNNSTYIVNDVDAGATLAATDFVVKVLGVHNFATSTFAGTSLTYA